MKRTTVITVAAIFSFVTFLACYWDRDTLAMEVQEFPTAFDLITGNFLRHSPEFYEWRVDDREQKLKDYPDSLSLYDDLAVAYSKLGKDKEAIKIALEKERIKPGLYETYANLGTFYLHDRQLERGIDYIDKAIEINPDAHFGREIYQRHLAEYILTKMDSTGLHLPLDTMPSDGYDFDGKPDNFYSFLLAKYNETKDANDQARNLPREELLKAMAGVEGMMKFGNYDSPILLEVLGDLLLHETDNQRHDMHQGARQLAFMAYTQASRNGPKEAKAYYRSKAWATLFNQNINNIREDKTDEKVQYVEQLLDDAIARAETFANEIRQDEINWIENGLNPEVEFDKKYYGESSAAETTSEESVGSAVPEYSEAQPETKSKQKSKEEESSILIYIVLGIGFLIAGAILLKRLMSKN